MTARQIYLVQHSWQQIKPVAQQAGMIFYEKLFAAEPQMKHLFKQDMHSQANKLVTMLGYVVAKLNRLEDILAEIKALGKRHQHYGAEPAHYQLVGDCLIATLRAGLGDKWNDELQDAWVTAFGILQAAMLNEYQEQSPAVVLNNRI
jgi:nitric oxide dioxygenase